MEHDVVIKEFKCFLQDISNEYDFSYEIINIRNFMRDVFSKKECVWSVFSDAERAILDSYTNPKKRIEWMSGRYVGKMAIKKHLIEIYKELDANCIMDNKISILNGFNKAPYIEGYPQLNISISHSYPYCIAVISDNSVGVDIESTFSISESMLKNYYTKHEINMVNMTDKTYFLDNGDNPKTADTLATLYWTRKEAISKLKKLGMNMDFRKIDTVNNISILDASTNEKVRTISKQNKYCTLSLAFQE